MRNSSCFIIQFLGFVFTLCWISAVQANSSNFLPEFIPADPSSDYLQDRVEGDRAGYLPIDFCAEWNPEFSLNGHRCCTQRKIASRRSRAALRCSSARRKTSYCGEMTTEQRQYVDAVQSGKITDLLTYLRLQQGRQGEQSYCGVNNGFLAWGRPIVPTQQNRLVIRNESRCLNFGTDPMVQMLEWVGLNTAKTWPDSVRIQVGDVSAPKGGCLPGRVGRKGHASHTSGKDVDIGFLSTQTKVAYSSVYSKQFDSQLNWWFLKTLFRNPYACIKVIFLDRKLIRKLQKEARGDEDWERYGRFVRHARNHQNHFHVRIGEGPGLPGCIPNAHPELEIDEGDGDSDTLKDFEEDPMKGIFKVEQSPLHKKPSS